MTSSSRAHTIGAGAGAIPRVAGLVPLLLFAAFAALYSIYPNNYPHYDELFHVLAGESWAANGTLETGDGVYTRTPLYTILVGELFKALGPSLAVARLPAIVAGALWVAAVYLFVRPWAGHGAAALAAVGFGLCPVVAEIAKMTRFYAVHGLLFTLGAFAVFHAVAGAPGPARRGAALAAGALCLLGALYFQVTTLIGVAALAAWAAGFAAVRLFGVGRRLLVAAGVAAAVGLLALLAAAKLGLLADAVASYRWTADWATERAGYERLYYDLLLGYYPALWPLFPFAAVYAFSRRPVLAGFCATVFGVGFVLHTFAGMKTERYIAYLMPFFWVVLGIAAAPVVALAWRAARGAAARAAGLPGLGGGTPARLVAAAVYAGALVGAAQFAAVNLALPETLHTLVQRVHYPAPDWAAAPAALGLGGTPQPVLLTPNRLHALYFIGDLHAKLGPAARAAGDEEGVVMRPDQRRPTVTTAAALARIVACNPAGALLADAYRWRAPGVTAPEIREYAERHLEAHPAGPDLNMVAYTWRHDERPGADCPAWAVFDRPLRLQAGPAA